MTMTPLTDSEKSTLEEVARQGVTELADYVDSLLAQRVQVAHLRGAVQALKEAAYEHTAELVCCDVYERLSSKSPSDWTVEERTEAQSHSICYWGAAATEACRDMADEYTQRLAEQADPGALADLAETMSARSPVEEVALVLMKAWAKADPASGVSVFPASYVATFVDMASAVLDHVDNDDH